MLSIAVLTNEVCTACFVYCVFDSVCELFGVVAILLLNVMDVFSVCGG